jgi:hypothetical protein
MSTRRRAAANAGGLFPPQHRDWRLSSAVPLTPLAQKRLARESACQPFQKAADAINEDWRCSLDRKQIQRWSNVLGAEMVAARNAERLDADRGRGPQGPANPPALLVVEMDGGRYQSTRKNPETGSRWREDKVGVVSSYRPGSAEQDPEPVVNTHVATQCNAEEFGRLLRVEAERRGVRRAAEAIVLGDGAAWIDAIAEREFPGLPRIVDWYHAAERLHDCANALYPADHRHRRAFVERLKDNLWQGNVAGVLKTLRKRAESLGPPRQSDGDAHPRRVLAENTGYFARRAHQMDYAAYRARGWPIGSGVVESGVKQIGKRVKGTEQFWNTGGIEPILALRAAWLSEDDRWNLYWRNRTAYPHAAAA